jgi:hypothetical protein
VTVRRVTGNVTTKFQYGYAGWGFNANETTLELLKRANGISFWILGDGKRYTMKYKTRDIRDYGYFEYSFNTERGKPLLVEVPIRYFLQPSWANPVRMNQNLVTGVEWQTHDSLRIEPNNPFDIKMWDFMIYN